MYCVHGQCYPQELEGELRPLPTCVSPFQLLPLPQAFQLPPPHLPGQEMGRALTQASQGSPDPPSTSDKMGERSGDGGGGWGGPGSSLAGARITALRASTHHPKQLGLF